MLIIGPWQMETARASTPALQAAGLAAYHSCPLPGADAAARRRARRLFAGMTLAPASDCDFRRVLVWDRARRCCLVVLSPDDPAPTPDPAARP
ncbi:hypothetical protein [Candidatus Amarolinea dominans]|uniref:hypothetical protein n=1 Tax=Candidatus Amarolinea dominans TaxID=3140696 RepID=UPI001DABF4A6|nr:hypothetical protein [Anaerolineae bacterium]